MNKDILRKIKIIIRNISKKCEQRKDFMNFKQVFCKKIKPLSLSTLSDITTRKKGAVIGLGHFKSGNSCYMTVIL